MALTPESLLLPRQHILFYRPFWASFNIFFLKTTLLIQISYIYFSRLSNRDPRASPWYSVPSSNFAKCVYALQNYWVYIIPSASLRAAIQPWASPWSSGRDYKIDYSTIFNKRHKRKSREFFLLPLAFGFPGKTPN